MLGLAARGEERNPSAASARVAPPPRIAVTVVPVRCLAMLVYRITAHYPMVVSVGRDTYEKFRSWSGWLVDGDVLAARGDNDVAIKGDDMPVQTTPADGKLGAIGQPPHPVGYPGSPGARIPMWCWRAGGCAGSP